SPLIQYLNFKTKSADRDSKSRGSFANIYALYVIIEDYINKGYLDSNLDYTKYDGAKFTDLLIRQRELPFGKKLQNHALNSRLNDEFKKYFPSLQIVPIIRDVQKQKYWLQEDLIHISIRDKNGQDKYENIALSIIQIVDKYIEVKTQSFYLFIKTCQEIATLTHEDSEKAIHFIKEQLQPNSDARIFEIISYAVLKAKYGRESIWIGYSKEEVSEEVLILYKTGRTNANDGGIDFVMKPLGRFFQVTETIDANKYFLDIDKVQRFPITFVVKTNDSPEKIKNLIRSQATAKYKIESIVNSYMDSIEEVINVPYLVESFETLLNNNVLADIMNEIIIQSKVEFNYSDEIDE
ncbi:restriction endonuclease, partial [Rodentibacter pneumotropicus]